MSSGIRHLFIFFLIAISLAVKSESQESHRHGLARLTLALEKGMVEIQLESPAASLVGFEHRAKSQEQRKAVRQAEMILKDPDLLFSFVGTHCQLKKTMVDVSGIMEAEHEYHSHLKKHDEGGHSEISTRYTFTCKDPKKLESVSVVLFKQFPGVEKIDVMWVTDSQQGAELLTPNRHAFSLR